MSSRKMKAQADVVPPFSLPVLLLVSTPSFSITVHPPALPTYLPFLLPLFFLPERILPSETSNLRS